MLDRTPAFASMLLALAACGGTPRPAAECPPCAERAAMECGAGPMHGMEPGGAAGVARPAATEAPDAGTAEAATTFLARVLPDDRHAANIAAPIEGVVESLRAEVGDHVAANDVVAVVVPPGGGRQVQVRTPAAGVVVERAASLGAAVAPHGPAMFFVADLSSVWVVAEVPQHELPRVQVGAPVSVQVAMFPDEVFHGQVERIHPAIDPSTGMGTLIVSLANPDGRLRPGADARVHLDPPPPAH